LIKQFFYYLVGPTQLDYPRPGLNVVIKTYKLALHPTASIDKAFLVIGMHFLNRQNDEKKTKFDYPVPN